MAKPQDCGNCKKPATIHLTQIINNQIKKLDFCDDCPHQKGVTDPEGFSLAELLANGPGATEDQTTDSTNSCPSCGFTTVEFKKTGQFGCPECYETFRDTIGPMLEGMHRGQTHAGRVPQRMLTRVNRRREIERLSRSLDEAVTEERFEDAARYRDELKQLNETLAGDSKESEENADK
ncbi:UvrB/UvrC motif-containing protein [Rubellicoccus peritrichatus]|uniref:UvrB/UvrC motif-containing protein n=1 Tax=Rubellicoccus peritrichatus TaxID=3080537 RepID=A0AAQ3QWV7_9BACT|nr:UvrB/UvrC motif-containing protein [Puniceicoccus sp. CR14]WOO42240.1 UvrB/UvrC motif-containing protein [Puniceicoccus sp. CR14]